MTGSVALDIVISLAFIYLLYSLLATTIQEILAAYVLNLRAKVLELAIQRMLDDDTGNNLFSRAFYSTSIIKSLAQAKGKKPSYLAARNFSKALLDLLKGSNTKPGEDFKKRIDLALDEKVGIALGNNIAVQSGETFEFIQSLWAEAHGDLERFKTLLEQWFDDTMNRASGWYKRKTQFILFFVGLAIAIIFNVDTIRIVQKLSRAPQLTAQIIQQADHFLKTHPDLDNELRQEVEQVDKLPQQDSAKSAEAVMKKYEDLKKRQDNLLKKADSLLNTDIKNVNGLIGIGIQSYEWQGKDCAGLVSCFLLSLMGWLITALALSLGAPFWFDLLNKLMKLRSSVQTVTQRSPSPDVPETEVSPNRVG